MITSRTPPRILVIDDLYAKHAHLRGKLRYECGLVQIDATTPDSELERLVASESGIAGAVYASGQIARGDLVEDSIEEVRRAVGAGWPSDDGWRWALILLDVEFASTPARPEDHTFGFKILEELVRRWPDLEARTGNSELPIVMLTSITWDVGSPHANRAGARAYVEKGELVRKKVQELLREHGLVEDDGGATDRDRLIGRSYSLLKVLREARRVARMGSGNALILGPQGSGKSSLARYIHDKSDREGPFVSYYSAPGAKELEYIRLFGHWEGAFTDAKQAAAGKAEAAQKGTLLIDEVHNLTPDTQEELKDFARPVNGQRLVRRQGHFPASSDKARQARATATILGKFHAEDSRIAVDVLMLSATNAPLDDPQWRKDNRFKEDLYTRLAIEFAGQPLRFPDLSQRGEDIPVLFEHFLRQETEKIGGRKNEDGTKSLDAEVKSMLRDYDWPGNVAQMQGVALEVARNTRDFTEVYPRHLPRLRTPGSTPTPPLPEPVDEKPSNSLDAAARVLKNVEVPSSAGELKGQLASLESAYAQLIKRVLESAFEEMRQVRGDERFITPTINNLFESKLNAKQAYGKILKLAKLFRNEPPPEPDSALAVAIQTARDSLNPHANKNHEEE